MAWIDKNLNQTLECINSFLSINSVTSDIASTIAEKNILIKKESNKFVASFLIPPSEHDIVKNLTRNSMPKFSVLAENSIYKIPESMVSLLRDNLLYNAGNNDFSVDINLYEIHDFPVKKKYFYRYFIPITSPNFNDFENIGYKNNGRQCGSLIEVYTLNAHLYTFSSYLVVEPLFKCEYRDLESIAYAMLLTLGFFSSTLHLQESYAVASETDSFETPIGLYYKSLRETIKSQYNIFTTNVYSVLVPFAKRLTCEDAENRMMNIIDKKWKFRINQISKDNFSATAEMFYKNESLARAASTILEASRLGLEIQVAAYCIALETICSHIINKNKSKNKVAKIANDADWKTISNDLKSIVNNSILSKESKSIFINKINNLNQPTNKDKLSLPFQIIGYQLSKEESNLLMDRNIFMHGSLNVNENENDADKLFYSSIMYHRLCCILLLKLSGFKGYIINNIAIHDFGTVTTNEYRWGFKAI